jgi:uncharacterized protein YacL
MTLKQQVHRLFFWLVTVGGGLAGILLAAYSSRYFQGLNPLTAYASYAALVILGLMGGLLLALPMTEIAVDAIETLILSLQRLAVGSVVMGALGMIFGLALAFFVSLVGLWLGPVLILLSALLFAGLGGLLGFRLADLPTFKVFFAAAPQVAEAHRVLVDSSVIIDGRLMALLETGFLRGSLVVPQFVLEELQFLADAEDPLRRVRGRRALDSLQEMRGKFSFEVVDESVEGRGADQKLLKLARKLEASILSNDYNLQKIAEVQGLEVLNVNQLAAALKPQVLPGQLLQVLVQREGKESHQGVGHLDDGTMVVVERGRSALGQEAIVEVTSVMQTATGRMVFTRFRHLAQAEEPPQEEIA